MGERDLEPREEKAVRRAIVERALASLRAEVKEPTLFAEGASSA